MYAQKPYASLDVASLTYPRSQHNQAKPISLACGDTNHKACCSLQSDAPIYAVGSSSLTLTTSRFVNHARLYCGQLLVFLTVEFFDRHVCRLEDSHMNAAAALLALAALPPVLAEATATAVLALAALTPVLAEAAAAAVLA